MTTTKVVCLHSRKKFNADPGNLVCSYKIKDNTWYPYTRSAYIIATIIVKWSISCDYLPYVTITKDRFTL